jgi:hypothetical protein
MSCHGTTRTSGSSPRGRQLLRRRRTYVRMLGPLGMGKDRQSLEQRQRTCEASSWACQLAGSARLSRTGREATGGSSRRSERISSGHRCAPPAGFEPEHAAPEAVCAEVAAPPLTCLVGSWSGGYASGVPAQSTRVKPLSLAALGLAVAVALALGGCSSGGGGPAADGPLSGGPYGSAIGQGDVCAPARVGQPWTFGIDEFTNQGHDTVTLDRVTLVHPQHEHLISSWLMPGAALIGIVPWPPRVARKPSTWKDRQPLQGFRLAPGKPAVIVLDVAPTAARRASSQGVTIYYHDPAGSYVTSSHFGLQFLVGKSSC